MKISSAIAVFAVLFAFAPFATAGGPTGSDITIVAFTFLPTNPVVTHGATVVVKNMDIAPHSVSADGGAFDTGSPTAGTYSFIAPATPGQYPYHCNLHSFMHGVLIVQ
ncbi:MAG: cupredoxin domain-containing protein [Thermoplasmatota archaeon]